MVTLSFRLPEDQHERLRQLAEQRQVNINHLMEELVTQMLATVEVYNHFQVRAARGSAQQGLELLEKLDEKVYLET
jgi:predicted transcriptional regulator